MHALERLDTIVIAIVIAIVIISVTIALPHYGQCEEPFSHPLRRTTTDPHSHMLHLRYTNGRYVCNETCNQFSLHLSSLINVIAQANTSTLC